MTSVAPPLPAELTDVEKIFNVVVKIFSTMKVDNNSMVFLIMKIMELAEKTDEAGIVKKQMVIDVLNMIVDKTDFVEHEQKDSFRMLINLTAPGIIDGLVSAYKKQVELSKKKYFCC